MSRSTNRRSRLTEPEIWFRIMLITPELRDLRKERCNAISTNAANCEKRLVGINHPDSSAVAQPPKALDKNHAQ